MNDSSYRPLRHRAATSRVRPLGRRLGAATLVAAVLAMLPLTASAERADRDKPLNFQSDNLAYDDLRQVNVLTGHVIITKGTIVIRADRVEVRQDPEGYQYAVATVTGSTPAYFRQKRDGVDEYIEGTSRRIDYNGKTDVTVLTTQAVVKRLSGLSKVLDEVHGSVITYDGQNDFYTASSGSDIAGPGNPTGRVHGTLAPGTTTPLQTTTTPAAPGAASATPRAGAGAKSAIPASAASAADTGAAPTNAASAAGGSR